LFAGLWKDFQDLLLSSPSLSDHKPAQPQSQQAQPQRLTAERKQTPLDDSDGDDGGPQPAQALLGAGRRSSVVELSVRLPFPQSALSASTLSPPSASPAPESADEHNALRLVDALERLTGMNEKPICRPYSGERAKSPIGSESS
jgi:hypothetical protein